MSLQKNKLRSAKDVIFSLLCVVVDRPMGELNLLPPLRTPLGTSFRAKRFIVYLVVQAAEARRTRIKFLNLQLVREPRFQI